jgi:ribosomal protein L40E
MEKMAFFDKMKDSLSLAGQGVSQKAKTVSETTKINGQIKANEKMIEKLIYQVGVQCVNNHINEENTEYEELFKEILRLRNENKEHQEMVHKLNTVKICPQCNFSNNSAAKFCVSCGAPLSSVSPLNSEADGKICPNCGSVNSEESMFCVECGTKLEAAPVKPTPVTEPDLTSVESSNFTSESSGKPAQDVQAEDLVADEIPVEAERNSTYQAEDESAASFVSAEQPEDDIPVKEEQANDVRVCKACGAVLADGAMFCVECGTKIAD